MTTRIPILLIALLAGACNGGAPAAPSQGVLVIEGALAFGEVVVGDTATESLTLRNTGNAALTVTGLSGPPGLSADWTSGAIAPGAAQIVTFTFAPSAPGQLASTVTVMADQTGSAPVTASVYPRLRGGWAGTMTFAISGASNTCTKSWIVSTQSGAAFQGTWQLSGGTTVSCGSAGTLSGQVEVSGALSGLTFGVAVGGLPAECSRVAGDAEFEGTVTGDSLVAQNTETIRCPDGDGDRAISLALTRQ